VREPYLIPIKKYSKAGVILEISCSATEATIHIKAIAIEISWARHCSSKKKSFLTRERSSATSHCEPTAFYTSY
jgi:hypothetical protein